MAGRVIAADGRRKSVAGKVATVEKVWLSNREAQRYMGCSKDFLCTLRETAELRFCKVRNTIFYKKADIDRLIERGRVI